MASMKAPGCFHMENLTQESTWRLFADKSIYVEIRNARGQVMTHTIHKDDAIALMEWLSEATK